MTLTVTDGQGHQSQKSLNVAVASKQLADRINTFATQTTAMLDDIQANAILAAEAADYFQEGVDGAFYEIAFKEHPPVCRCSLPA